jgi:protein ImuB
MPRVLQSLDLFAPEPVEAPWIERRPARSRPQLWIGVCLPNLPLECVSAALLPGPAVVVAAQQGRRYVIASNQEAIDAGIAPGLEIRTATTLAAALQIFEREPRRELASLESLARWAQGLTSTVSVESQEGLLLEVAGSLKLYGGIDAIKAKLREELVRRRHVFRLAAAPTATAALWLARAAGADVASSRAMAGRLGALPLGVTRWPPAVQALLRDLGARTIGDCVRLPRDGFARRVGNAYLRELDRAFGRDVDLRAEFRAPDTWTSKVELFEESVDSALFMEAIEQILDELTAELRKRQAQIASLEIAFEHLHRPPTLASFDFLEPVHERERLLHLVRDRVERSVLPVPAIALRMNSGVLLPLTQREAGLFEKQPLEELVRVLLERLRERFGSAAVYGLRAIAEHRPERAWAKWVGIEGSRLRREERSAERQARPLWLLPAPLPLSSADAGRASLELTSGPERIESGWWDERDVGRDYYTVSNAHGQRLWVFRDHRTRSWYLHGLFG